MSGSAGPGASSRLGFRLGSDSAPVGLTYPSTHSLIQHASMRVCIHMRIPRATPNVIICSSEFVPENKMLSVVCCRGRVAATVPAQIALHTWERLALALDLRSKRLLVRYNNAVRRGCTGFSPPTYVYISISPFRSRPFFS